jgi:hypothetical protein
MMPFTSHCRTALQTVGQIEFTDGAESSDHFLLIGIHHSHLVIRGHAAIYVSGLLSRDFEDVQADRGDDRPSAQAWTRVNGTPEPRRLRVADPTVYGFRKTENSCWPLPICGLLAGPHRTRVQRAILTIMYHRLGRLDRPMFTDIRPISDTFGQNRP